MTALDLAAGQQRERSPASGPDRGGARTCQAVRAVRVDLTEAASDRFRHFPEGRQRPLGNSAGAEA